MTPQEPDEFGSTPSAGSEKRATVPWSSAVTLVAGFLVMTVVWNLLPHDPTQGLRVLEVPGGVRGMKDWKTPPNDDDLRVLVLGASLASGFPYMPPGVAAFTSLLEVGLSEVLPEKNVDCQFLARPALDSVGLAVAAENLASYQPSVWIVTLGSNEYGNRLFAERTLIPRTPVEWVEDRASRFQVALAGAQATLASAEPKVMQGRGEALLANLGDSRPAQPGLDALPITEQEQHLLVRRTQAALARISAVAADRDTPLVFCLTSDNLASTPPLGMLEVIPEIDALVFDAWQAPSRLSLAKIEPLLERFPRRADLHFLHGQALLREGKSAQARVAFQKARDLDAAPLHRNSIMDQGIRDQAKRDGHLCWDLNDAVPLPESLGIPDPDRFLDIVHLTAEGHRDVALFLAEKLAQEGAIPPLPEGWRPRFLQACNGYLEENIQAADEVNAVARMELGMASWTRISGNFRDALPYLCRSATAQRDQLTGPDDPAMIPLTNQFLTCALGTGGILDRHDEALEEAFRGQLWQAIREDRVEQLAYQTAGILSGDNGNE